jgi:hypothetical protein
VKVGSLELAKQLGNVTYVIGTGRAADRQKTLDFGAHEFADLDCSRTWSTHGSSPQWKRP